METSKILNADVLDIIFNGRNKEYGAYTLRKNYNKRLATALMTMGATLLLFGFGSALANAIGGKKDVKMQIDQVVTLEKIPDPPKPIAPPPPPPPVTAPPPQVSVRDFTPPKIVPDDVADNPPPTTDDLNKSKIGLINQDGIDDNNTITPPVASNTGTGPVVSPKVAEEDYDRMFVKVEKPATFQGGFEGWKRFLERTVQYPEAAQEEGRQGVVRVQMVVDKEGNVSDVKTLNSEVGADLAAEAERIIKKGPKWIPAEQNGRKVTYRFVQTITFQLNN